MSLSIQTLAENGLNMLEQFWVTISNSSIFIALITIAFFTIKGLLWLVIPFMFIRWRVFSPKKTELPSQKPSI